MGFEDEVFLAVGQNSSVGLSEVIKNNVFYKRFAVVDWLFADDIEPGSKFGR